MSTRATYRIENSRERRPTVTLYVHHDGYGSGAAKYFYDTLTSPCKGNLAEKFIRAVPEAELTHGHDSHGDTDYRYTVTFADSGPDATLTVLRFDRDTDQYVGVFLGSLADFINQHPEAIENYHPFRAVKLRYNDGTELLNLVTAKQKLVDSPYSPIYHLRVWSKSFGKPCSVETRKSANWQSCVTDAKRILNVFPELLTDEIKSLLA